MENVIVVVILLAIIGLAGWYVYKAKKSGKKCIGCPDGGCNCSSKMAGCGGGCCGCGSTEDGSI